MELALQSKSRFRNAQVSLDKGKGGSLAVEECCQKSVFATNGKPGIIAIEYAGQDVSPEFEIHRVTSLYPEALQER
jgi:hypothetical protein